MKKSLMVLFSLVMFYTMAWANGAADTDGGDTSNYPSRVIDVYVGHGAGGGTDSFVRTITNLMAEDLG